MSKAKIFPIFQPIGEQKEAYNAEGGILVFLCVRKMLAFNT